MGNLKAEETALLAKLALYDARDRFQDDIFLSSLAESSTSLSLHPARWTGLTLTNSYCSPHGHVRQ